MKSFVFISILLIVNVLHSHAESEFKIEPISELQVSYDYGNVLAEHNKEESSQVMIASPLIIDSQDTVLFDFSNAFCTPSYMQVPVKFNSDDMIYAMDFALQFDPGVFTYISIINHQSYLSYSANYNSSDSTLRFTSFSFQPMDNNTNLISIRFSLPVSQIDYAQFDSVYTLLNGDISSSKAIESIPPAVISVGGPIIIFPGDSISLSINPVQGLSYLWSNGETDSLIYVNSPGTYFVNTFFPNGCNAITYIQIYAPDPLPIDLLNFYASQKADKILIYWATAAEINNSHFNLERSSDGLNWMELASIEGAGNSSSTLNYSYVDSSPFLFWNYYRLKQVDFDGLYTYSSIIGMKFQNDINDNNDIKIYPNPSYKRDFVLEFQNFCESVNSNLSITNSLGKIVYRTSLLLENSNHGNVLIKVNLEHHLPGGIYFVTYRCEGEEFVEKLILY